MIDFLELCENRRSIRSFTDQPVEFDDVLYVIRCGMLAPSAGDLQPWDFVIITDSKLCDDVAGKCPNQAWMHQAPVIVAIIGDQEKMNTYYREFGESWLNYCCAAATENMLLAACDRGLGACWVSSFVREDVEELLGIPAANRLVGLVAIGRPDPGILPEKQIRPLDQVVNFDSWGRKQEDLHIIKRDFYIELNRRREEVKEQVEKLKQDLPAKSDFKMKLRSLFGGKKK